MLVFFFEIHTLKTIVIVHRTSADSFHLHARDAVTSNIQHLKNSSGIAGLVEAIMVLEKGTIPPNTNFERLNPKIDAEFLNVKVTRLLLYFVVFL